eukprot:8466869-Karenia_brevis.AAC.1
MIECPAAASGRPLLPIHPIWPLDDTTLFIHVSSNSSVFDQKPRGVSINANFSPTYASICH